MKENKIMKNQNIVFIAIAAALAFALAPIAKATITPQGGPSGTVVANESPDGENLPVVSIYSAGNILRGKTGSFVLDMKPALMFGGTYVNFKISGTALPGVDYVALASPAYIGQSGKGVLLIATLPDRRASMNRQAYSVVVTLEPGAGYTLAEPKSAVITTLYA